MFKKKKKYEYKIIQTSKKNKRKQKEKSEESAYSTKQNEIDKSIWKMKHFWNAQRETRS